MWGGTPIPFIGQGLERCLAQQHWVTHERSCCLLLSSGVLCGAHATSQLVLHSCSGPPCYGSYKTESCHYSASCFDGAPPEQGVCRRTCLDAAPLSCVCCSFDSAVRAQPRLRLFMTVKQSSATCGAFLCSSPFLVDVAPAQGPGPLLDPWRLLQHVRSTATSMGHCCDCLHVAQSRTIPAERHCGCSLVMTDEVHGPL